MKDKPVAEHEPGRQYYALDENNEVKKKCILSCETFICTTYFKSCKTLTPPEQEMVLMPIYYNIIQQDPSGLYHKYKRIYGDDFKDFF